MGTPRNSLTKEHTASILGSVNRKSYPLRFGETEKGPMAERDYGLMKISSNKSQTPYPRVEKGVDPDMLKARLKDRRHSEASSRRLDESLASEVIIEKIHLVKLDPAGVDRQREEEREKLLMGTPHPKKGNAVDPKLLIKHLKFSTTSTSRRRSLERDSTFGRRYSKRPSKRSKQVLNARSNLLKRCKKRVLINPHHQSIDDLDSADGKYFQDDCQISQFSSLFGSRTSFTKLDFEERRRKFYEAEFTIAKKGKRIGESMTVQPNTAQIVEKQSWFASDNRAKEEIEKFIIKQGFVKTRNDQLTTWRQQSRLSHYSDRGYARSSHYSRSSQASLRSIVSLKSPRIKLPH
ncbi:uncharacterized protein Dwil_GK13477 [Drosophila willistoni]|uniref:Uncharacterized protein n=1 Tax=Drosophila willistoni TaxID=7260 RepID=B4NJ29_DROWI|nr:uncharacterized protein LOC6650264 [Drosophila willistoni]EDW83822.1 uncharacterized protein Dwil_GK13477 [Drosophila willistoni]